jgi:colicin import membrane protein
MPRVESRLAALASATFLLLTGCEDDAKIRDIQRLADERVAKAERDAHRKLQDMEKQIEALKAEAADAAAQAKTEAESAIREAKASSEEQAKLAEQALARARAAYKAEARTKLSLLEREVRELTAKASKASPKLKAAAGKSLKEIQGLLKTIATDLAAFDSATLETFGKTKAKLEQDFAKLKRAIQAARAKLSVN